MERVEPAGLKRSQSTRALPALLYWVISGAGRSYEHLQSLKLGNPKGSRICSGPACSHRARQAPAEGDENWSDPAREELTPWDERRGAAAGLPRPREEGRHLPPIWGLSDPKRNCCTPSRTPRGQKPVLSKDFLLTMEVVPCTAGVPRNMPGC